MTTIVTRSGKGSALTHAEVDANFDNLNTDKIERTGAVAYTGKQTFVTPSTSSASILLPHGASPTTPADGDTWTTTSGLFARINGSTQQYVPLSGGTFTGLVATVASTAGTSGFRLPHGVAPTSPSNGDTWSTTTGMFMRVSSVTRQFADLDSTQTLASKTLTTPICNGIRMTVVTQTSAYTATTSVSTILCSATTAAFTVTLPTSVGNSGLVYRIKKIDSSANAITIATTSSQTIDGALTYSLPTQWNFVVLQSDGTNWVRVG
mgnify:CR=1 FL=1